MRNAVAAAALLALAGCDSADTTKAPPAQPTPKAQANIAQRPLPEHTPAPGDLPAPEFAGAAMAEGEWSQKMLAGGPAALFGPAGTEARFIIRCDPQARQVIFIWSGAMPAPGAAMHIATDAGAATFPAHAADTELPQVQAESAASFPFLTDVLAREPERIAVTLGDQVPLVMPGAPAVGDVIRTCARG
ncbi:hypothetical protein [Stakelama saccharophila]|uniref:Uncharacterized protein n=1 Tax=Stakelama saccharophila TaxID=3075605 RepID=A0ABZ0BAU7_9SPHN|nr:hypothetical protein [Stakelama sp. W311]WNO54332.1 hypothetical protein RPR59_03490 [Stakelama sp. W311]